jgi:lipoate synthase
VPEDWPPAASILVVRIGGKNPSTPRLPGFLRKPFTNFESVQLLKNDLRRLKLHTVRESARRPNLHECFHRGAATFLILGNLRRRGCAFCAVPEGAPAKGVSAEFSQRAAGVSGRGARTSWQTAEVRPAREQTECGSSD